MKNPSNIDKALIVISLAAVLGIFVVVPASGGERTIIDIRDMTQMEVKSGGFSLPRETRIHITALGGGVDKYNRDGDADLFAYGWIIDANTREKVWMMSRKNTDSKKGERLFDGSVTLSAGDYEVYYTAYAYAIGSTFTNFNMNIDRRKKNETHSIRNKNGFMNWLEDLFDGQDGDGEWTKRAKTWGITLAADDGTTVTTFAAPKPFRHVLYESIHMGENEHVTQQFSIAKPMSIHIYALGEMGNDKEPADYAWIVDAKSRRRFWQMSPDDIDRAGGAQKNVKIDRTVNFPAGDYALYYISDDSHSYLDWNAAPPYDPLHYGITLMNTREGTDGDFKLHASSDDQNVIVEMIRMRDGDSRSQSFTLKSDADVRVYALGERNNSGHEMADYGWIISARTREKVWTMDPDRSEHAGGATKNRMVDEIIHLSKGTYTVYYQTDDSHAYSDWNSSPPFDPEHWGITVSLVGSPSLMSIVDKNVTPKQTGVISQITRVGNSANKTEYFKLDKPTKVRVYALGEGQNREMYDYGWIENTSTGTIVWQMTYDMSFHAGGGRKNRIVNTTITLDKGSYKLRYRSDDSHSYNDWNTDPPDDPVMWGITLYEDQQ